jgi:nitric oxide reductase large subunit
MHMNLTTDSVRAIIALSIVLGALLVCALLVLLPLLGGIQNTQNYTAMLKDFGGLFSGIIGTIIGYYFGKSSDQK